MNDILLHPLPWGIAVLFGALIGSSMFKPTHDRKVQIGRFASGSFLTLLVLLFADGSEGRIFIGYIVWAAGIALMISARQPPSTRR